MAQSAEAHSDPHAPGAEPSCHHINVAIRFRPLRFAQPDRLRRAHRGRLHRHARQQPGRGDAQHAEVRHARQAGARAHSGTISSCRPSHGTAASSLCLHVHVQGQMRT